MILVLCLLAVFAISGTALFITWYRNQLSRRWFDAHVCSIYYDNAVSERTVFKWLPHSSYHTATIGSLGPFTWQIGISQVGDRFLVFVLWDSGSHSHCRLLDIRSDYDRDYDLRTMQCACERVVLRMLEDKAVN